MVESPRFRTGTIEGNANPHLVAREATAEEKTIATRIAILGIAKYLESGERTLVHIGDFASSPVISREVADFCRNLGFPPHIDILQSHTDAFGDHQHYETVSVELVPPEA